MRTFAAMAIGLLGLTGAAPAHAQYAMVSDDTRGHIETMAVRSGLRIIGDVRAGNLSVGRSVDFWFPIGPRDAPQAVLVACDNQCDGFRFTVFDEFGFEIGSPANAAHFVFRPEGRGDNFYVRVTLDDCSTDICNVGVAKVGQ